MKITKQWAFVGYGAKIDPPKENGDDIVYFVVHPRKGESLEHAVQRAKTKVEEACK